eukprot:CAMPEP_0115349814 /NCGR_PEP_ID=MMETSP0270-20121206/96131_1 /TAXON_ID=71861 /ORGANISM="Scrippsiella trochoidea, Strain CCMP3099" /LENGTH=46 /DNA_ID= /DNA_START= /DNA_END= /DNA_ORIENTATION=
MTSCGASATAASGRGRRRPIRGAGHMDRRWREGAAQGAGLSPQELV